MDLRNDLIKGADISSLLEVEEAGGRFFDKACRDGSQPSAVSRMEKVIDGSEFRVQRREAA